MMGKNQDNYDMAKDFLYSMLVFDFVIIRTIFYRLEFICNVVYS